MPITVHRGDGAYAMLRRMVVRLDGREVGRLSRGASVVVAGTGAEQQLTVWMDWTTCPPLPVRDPGPDATLTVRVVQRPMLQALWRSFLTPHRLWHLEVVDDPAGRTGLADLGL